MTDWGECNCEQALALKLRVTKLREAIQEALDQEQSPAMHTGWGTQSLLAHALEDDNERAAKGADHT